MNLDLLSTSSNSLPLGAGEVGSRLGRPPGGAQRPRRLSTISSLSLIGLNCLLVISN